MKYNKGFAPLILVAIIVGVLVIGGGSYYLGVNKNIKKENPENNSFKQQQNSDYLTYKDDTQYGFQFDYLKKRFLNEFKHGTKTTIYIGDCSPEDPNCLTSQLAFIIEVDKDIKNESDLKAYLYGPTKSALDGNYYDCTTVKPFWTDGVKIDEKNVIQFNRTVCAGSGAGIKYPVPILGTIYNNRAYIINFQNGEYTGNEKEEFDNLVSSFKFINVKDPSIEFFNGEPGEIKLIKVIMDNNESRISWEMDVDIFSGNPKWEPGSDEDLYLNQSKEIRKFIIDSKTETYECGNSIDGNIITSLRNTSKYVDLVENGDVKSFYTTGLHVDKIFDICLP